VPDVPRQKLMLGGEYTRSFGPYAGFLHVDWSHQGAVPTGFTYKDVRPAYSALDASLGLRGDHYEVSVYGHNLTNSNGILSIQEGTPYSYGTVFKTQISTPPRTIGIDLKMHF
jgi:outer membrane receptor protein involved in Fe transport